MAAPGRPACALPCYGPRFLYRLSWGQLEQSSGRCRGRDVFSGAKAPMICGIYATASDYGSPAGYGWFPDSPVAPASVLPLLRRSAAHSTAPCLAEAGRKPWPRSAASAPCFLGTLAGWVLGLIFARYIALLLYQVKTAQADMLAMPVLAILGITCSPRSRL